MRSEGVVSRTRKIGILMVLAALPALFACEAPPPAVAVGKIDISIKLQRAFVYDTNGALMREIPVSSGAGGRTPLGNFRVYSRSSWTTSASMTSPTRPLSVAALPMT